MGWWIGIEEKRKKSQFKLLGGSCVMRAMVPSPGSIISHKYATLSRAMRERETERKRACVYVMLCCSFKPSWRPEW